MARREVSSGVAAAAILALAAVASAQGCLEPVGSWPYGPPWAITVSGGYAYYSSGAAFIVADSSDPASLRVVGEVTLPDQAWHIAVAGKYAFVAMGPHGLRIVDVSLPWAPVEVGFLDTPGWAREVAVSGGYAYVADDGGIGRSDQVLGTTGLVVIDVSTPSAPVAVGVSTAPARAWGVALSDGYAYVADEGAGLVVIDVSTPSAPRFVARTPFPGEAVDVVVSGGHAYVAACRGGLRVLDVSTPSSPVEVGSFDTLSCAKEVVVSGTTAYVMHDGFMSSEAGLQVVDIGTPSSPVELGRYGTPGYALDLAVSGGYAHVTVDETVRVVDVRTPASPAEVTSHQMPGPTFGIAESDGYVYLADVSAGLRVMDMTTPSSPVEVMVLDLQGQESAFDVQVLGQYAYAAGPRGLSVLDLSTPSAPVEVGFVGTAAYPDQVEVVGHHVYVVDLVGDLEPGVRILDVSTPSAPEDVGSWAMPGSPVGDLVVSEGYAYLVYVRGVWDFEAVWGLQIVDVRDPSSPVEVGRFENWNCPLFGVGVHEGYAYLICQPGEVARVVVWDVSTPSSPVDVGSQSIRGWIQSMAITDGLAYLVAGTLDRSELLVLDLGNPRYVRPLAAHRLRGSGHISVADGGVYAAEAWSGFEVFDVSACLGWVPPPRRPRGRQSP